MPSVADFGEWSWQAATLAALAACMMLLLVGRGRSLIAGILLRAGAAVVAAAAVLAIFSIAAGLNAAAERRIWQARAGEMAASALAPGSTLGCLDSEAGEAVENACEKAVFARPETAAAAVAYTAGRLTLLSDARKLSGGDSRVAVVLAGLRRAIELDRFGLAAQVLATRDGCTADQCPAFALLTDATILKANLKARAYDTYVARYAAEWTKEPSAPAKPPEEPPAQTSAAEPPGAPFSSRYDFPSAASIPPVSIMNSEPPRPPDASQPPPDTADAPPRLPPKRPQTQGAATR